ncbi:MAG: D-glycero-beta-D-manno-heptose-7-phosphate kinase [Acidobacteriota bacterium]|nr:D-glycero-beta-D-manno-heptose-7-phosphate kinase [Acidobacteriota bacterium]
MENWQKVLGKFAEVRVLVIGDVMLDRYWWGTVSRISPEAPVPVVKLEKTELKAGGAANVAANVSSLGATSLLLGVKGEDEAGRALPQILEKFNVAAKNLISFPHRPTTTKTRIVAHSQQVVRIDEEQAAPLNNEQAEIVRQTAKRLLPEVEAIVLSDYAKGCLCDSVLSSVIETARRLNKVVLVDPKGKNYEKYNGATLLTPNKSEAAAASGVEITDEQSLIEAGNRLLENLEIEFLLITLGEDGMRLFERGKESKHFPAMTRAVYDVTGAGDTVIAALAVALGASLELPDAVKIANTAAGLAVEEVGTTPVSAANLATALQIETGDNLKK